MVTTSHVMKPRLPNPPIMDPLYPYPIICIQYNPRNLLLYTPVGYIRNMHADIKKKVIRRLNLIRGQLAGLIEMTAKERYCVDIITQSSAIKEALSGVERLILENHLSTHVVGQMRGGKEKMAIGEILKIYRLAQRKK